MIPNNESGKSGLIEVTCVDGKEKRSSSIMTRNIPDAGPRTFDLVLMAVLASMVPDIPEGDQAAGCDIADYNKVLRAINDIYCRLEGISMYIDICNYNRDTIKNKVRVIRIDLDPINRIEYDKEIEPAMAKAVLSAV